MKRHGKLIVIDGIDGAGKATQSALLIDRFKREGYATATFDFPQYEQFFGHLIAEYLRGEFGDPANLPPKLIAVLYAADRWSALERLQTALEAGKIVITNRYVSSNINYQAARVAPRQRSALRSWTSQLDYGAFGLPRADLTLFLHVSVKTSRRLVKTKRTRAYLKGKRQDVHERDHRYMETVAQEYVRYCRTEPTAQLIRCERKGQLLPIEAIHERIWAIVQPLLEREK